MISILYYNVYIPEKMELQKTTVDIRHFAANVVLGKVKTFNNVSALRTEENIG